MILTHQITKYNSTLHMVNFHCNKIMFDSIYRELLYSREIEKWNHLGQTLNFHCLKNLRHLEILKNNNNKQQKIENWRYAEAILSSTSNYKVNNKKIFTCCSNLRVASFSSAGIYWDSCTSGTDDADEILPPTFEIFVNKGWTFDARSRGRNSCSKRW